MNRPINEAKVVFLGDGFMATAIIDGMVQSGAYPAKNIYVKGIIPEKTAALAEKYGLNLAVDTDISDADIVVLAFKPQGLGEAAEMYAPLIKEGTTVISILAGITISSLEKLFAGTKIVRVMPNLALSVGVGASGYSLGSLADESDALATEAMFGGTGITARVEEEKLADIMALSGSGPAYFCLMCEELMRYANECGLEEDTARRFAVQTLLGAAKLSAVDNDPATVRSRITSPGGTTNAAICAMQEAGIAHTIEKGYDACKKRGEELAK